MKRRTYRISPSLMNSFSEWLNAEDTYAKFWGNSKQPEMTCEEYVAKQLSELLSKINKEPQPLNEAADRGTCLNEIVDCLIGAEPNPNVWWDKINGDYEAERNGFHFVFDGEMVDNLAITMRNGIPQFHLRNMYAPQGVDYEVMLHGYADYIFPTYIFDLKTTGKYDGEKYIDNWQRLVYPVVAVDSDDMLRCDCFCFHVVEIIKPKECTKMGGRIWRETYDVNIEQARAEVLEFITAVMVPQLDKWHNDGLTPNQTICDYE